METVIKLKLIHKVPKKYLHYATFTTNIYLKYF